MSTVGIIQIHDEINRAKGACCYICFRPGSDRRLVEPQSLNILLSKLSNGWPLAFKNKFQVCYICEAQARSAVRFVKAVELAAKVNKLFSEISKGQWQDIVNYLHTAPGRRTELQQDCPPRRALRLEGELSVSPRYELFRSDTLLVNGGVATSTKSAPASSQLPRSDMLVVMQHEDPTMLPMLPLVSPIILPALPQGSGASRLPELSIDPDQKHMRVLNKDTNEYILHPMLKGVDGNIYVPTLQLQILDSGLLKSVDKTLMQQRLPSTYTPNIPNLNTTNLNSANLNSTNLNSANLNSTDLNSANLNFTNKNSTNLNSTVNKRQMNSVDSVIEKSKEKSAYYNFLVSQMRQKGDTLGVNKVEIIKMNDLNIVLNVDDCEDNTSKKKRKDRELDQTLCEVAHLLNKNAEGECEIKYELIEDDDDDASVPSNQESSNHDYMPKSGAGDQVSTSANRVFAGSNQRGNKVLARGNQVSSGCRVTAGGNRVSAGNQVSASNVGSNGSKEPVLRTDRTVDWEDKIPMDVISFMDATDPNPQERIMQPAPMGFISDVRSVPDVPDSIECIDLC